MTVTSVETVCLLTPEGEIREHPDYPRPPDDPRELYRDMLLTRRVDTEATALQRTGELGLWSPSLGQEAIQVASAHAMRPGDRGFPTYREVGVMWSKGVDPVELLHLYRGVTHGGWDPEERNLGLFTIVIGSQALHAVGYAMGIQRDGTEDAAIAYFGDGASSQGDVHEAMVFASLYAAPVVFVCQNNQWAISIPVERQATVPISLRAAGYGMPGVRVDGNDVLGSLAVVRAALERAREGGGPTLIEAVTYRMGAHTTSDDPTRYRPEQELAVWAERDPIERLRRLLVAEERVDQAWLDAVEAEADELGERIRAGIRGMADPHPLDMFDHAYAEPHAAVEQHRQEWAAHMEQEGLA